MSDIGHPTAETIKNFQKSNKIYNAGHQEIASPPAEVVS
jgi:hypothetical protein